MNGAVRAICLAVLLFFGHFAMASSVSYWAAYWYGQPAGIAPTRHGDYFTACTSIVGIPQQPWYWYTKAVPYASNRYDCYRAYSAAFCPSCGNQYIGWAVFQTDTCVNGHTGYECNSTPKVCNSGTFDAISNKCVVAEEKGEPDQSLACDEPGKKVGNPINFATGNKYNHEIYYRSPQSNGIRFERFYNSSDTVWRHSYSERLSFLSNEILLTMADGKVRHFTLSGAPKDSSAAAFGTLQPINGGWQLLTKALGSYEFDSQGRLTRLQKPNGPSQQLSYNSAGTSSQVFVTDDFGNQINFKVNSAGILSAFNAPNLVMSFSNSPNQQLTKATIISNGQQLVRQYHYEDPYNSLNLTGITDERGVRYVTWKYDSEGRAISSEHAGRVDKVLISYNADGSSTVTNELGKKTTYRYLTIAGIKHITSIQGEPSANCPNSNSSFTYDERGLLKTKIDNKGHLTTYDYNARGLEVSRTEASGTPQARTITTEWHPTLFLPTVVTEPDRIIRYQYDDQGRQLSRTVEAR